MSREMPNVPIVSPSVPRSGAFVVEAEQVEVVDNTGAGDVYNAGFLAGMLLGKPLSDCALFATKVAGKSVTGLGRDRYPTGEDLRGFFDLTKE